MAITNLERVGKAMELLRDGVRPFVERELKSVIGTSWSQAVAEVVSDSRLGKGKSDVTNDVSVLLIIMDRKWNEVFRSILGKADLRRLADPRRTAADPRSLRLNPARA